MRAVVSFGGGTLALFAQASFTSTINLGAILVALIVLIVAGFFQLRDKRSSGWKDLYEQERAKNEVMADDKEAERIIRHKIKDELAETKALLLVEQAKPDLSVIIERQQSLWADALGQLTTVLGTMQETQKEMLDLLRSDARTTSA